MARELPCDLGHYRLVEKLGAGGMGVVYRAIDTTLDRPVAIKMMLGLDALGDPDAADEIRERFLREARAAARIRSRFVAQVLQLGTSDAGEVYIVMELLHGLPLSKVLSRSLRAGGPLAPERVIHIALQVCRGMQAAHDLGVVHRDLKPANIMLVDEDGDPDTAKILDFGVAKLTNDEQTRGLTQAGALLGTLPFMAPEQLTSQPVDNRTDIYALGVMLYRMFTGMPLWDVEGMSEIVRSQLTLKPPSMFERVTNPRFTPAVDNVVLRCLQKDPANRWQSMRELGEALEQAQRPSEVSSPFAGVTRTNGDAVLEDPETLKQVSGATEEGTLGPTTQPTKPGGVGGEDFMTLAAGGNAERPRQWPMAAAAVVVIGIVALAGFGWSASRPRSPEAPTTTAEAGGAAAEAPPGPAPAPAATPAPTDPDALADATDLPDDDDAAPPEPVVDVGSATTPRPKPTTTTTTTAKPKPTKTGFVRVRTKDAR